jgi:hypothetical protein
MKRIFVPTQGPSDWQRLLAKPTLHWKKSYSAMTTAACWEAADGELPYEVKQIFQVSGQSDLLDLKLLAAIPEWEVALPGGTRPSHTDVLALARNDEGLVVICVEAKVDEPFGPTLGEKRAEESNGQSERINYLHAALHLDVPLNNNIRYQLLHRTVSALRTAQDFHADSAVMLVHSFSPTHRWHEDFSAFCQAMASTLLSPDFYAVPRFKSPRLYMAWCAGDGRFLNVELPSMVYQSHPKPT